MKPTTKPDGIVVCTLTKTDKERLARAHEIVDRLAYQAKNSDDHLFTVDIARGLIMLIKMSELTFLPLREDQEE